MGTINTLRALIALAKVETGIPSARRVFGQGCRYDGVQLYFTVPPRDESRSLQVRHVPGLSNRVYVLLRHQPGKPILCARLLANTRTKSQDPLRARRNQSRGAANTAKDDGNACEVASRASVQVSTTERQGICCADWKDEGGQTKKKQDCLSQFERPFLTHYEGL